MILVAREPRNTRAIGPRSWSRPRARHRAPTRCRRSRRPSSRRARRRSRGPAGTAARSATFSSAARAAASISSLHCSSWPDRPSCRRRTCRAAAPAPRRRRCAATRPTRAATAAAATTRSSAPSGPLNAAVTRSTRAPAPQRCPRGVRATGRGELCSRRPLTLPTDTCPKAPAEDDPTTIILAPCRSAASTSPAGAERAWWTSSRGRDVLGQPFARPLQHLGRGALEVGLVLGVHLRRAGRPRLRDDRAEQKLVAPGAGQHAGEVQDRLARAVRCDAHEHGHDVPSLAAASSPRRAWLRP